MKIAVAGATGEVGRAMTKVLQDLQVKPDEITFLASERSAGKEITFYNKSYKVEVLSEESITRGYDYILFSAGSKVSRQYAPLAAEAGSLIIDNSSAFRMEENIPLVVPEINGSLLKGYKGIVANPNCSTIQMVLSLYRIHEHYGIQKIVVSTYQAVSGAGHKGVAELEAQEGGDLENRAFSRQIHRNLIPQIGDFLDDGFSEEEMKMVNETKKILGDESILIWPSTVRVPVEYSHSETIYAETAKSFDLEELTDIIRSGENVTVTDDFTTPLDAAGKDATFVSRIRSFNSTGFVLWNVADNIRVGAATNAVRILKKHASLNDVK